MAEVVTLTMNPALDMVVEMAALAPEQVNKARRAETFCGGKGINVSLVLSLSGIPSHACGVLGESNAALFETFCRERGIGFQFDLAPGATRTNVKLAVDGCGATDINLPGLTIAPAILDALRYRLDKLVGGGDIVVLSGSLPPTVPNDFYAGLITRLKHKGAAVYLDASGAPLADGLAAGPDLAKPNREELLALDNGAVGNLEKSERNAQVAESAQRWLRRGVGEMAVSMGGDGAMLAVGDAIYLASPAPVKAVNLVGAGDTFVAGMVASRLHGLAPDQSLAYATALSGHWVERMDRGKFSAHRVDELLKAVEITTL